MKNYFKALYNLYCLRRLLEACRRIPIKSPQLTIDKTNWIDHLLFPSSCILAVVISIQDYKTHLRDLFPNTTEIATVEWFSQLFSINDSLNYQVLVEKYSRIGKIV